MSIRIKSATTKVAALAVGALVSLAATGAFANTKGPAPHNPPGAGQHPAGGAGLPPVGGTGYRSPGGTGGQNPAGSTYHPGKLVRHGGYYRGHWGQDEYCYWLPTVSGGSVSGLKPVCYWVKN